MWGSVRTKILLVTGAVVLVALAVNTYIDTRLFRTHYTHALESQALTAGRGLVYQIQHLLRLGIPLEELIGFDVQCREVVKSVDDIDYAMVIDHEGTVLFHNRSEFHGQRVTAPEVLAAIADQRETIVTSNSGANTAIDALIPLVSLDGRPTAFVRVGIPLANVTRQVDTFVMVASLVSIASLSVAVVLVLFIVGRLILRPLGQLNMAMQSVGSGATDLESRVEVKSKDELGTIASAFNHMLEALRQSRSDIEQYTRELESKVEERTHELQLTNELLKNDVKRRRAAERRYQHLAHHDALTGLPNRFFMTEYLEGRVARAERYGSTLALMFLDLDRFKQINDTLGHASGDALLIEVAHRLKNRLRREDTVARLGGDEFLILLEHPVEANAASKVASELIEKLTAPIDLDGHELVVTTSVGIALFPDDGQTSTELLKNADAAMYKAKQLGRNRWQFYTAEMNGRSMERLVLESDLRKAILAEEFELFYQPRIVAKGNLLAGAEALLRWRHPRRGLLNPGEFLGLAESSGMIVQIGDWVLREACKVAAGWIKDGNTTFCISVNVSARQVFQGNLVAVVDSALADTGLAPGQLEIEIVEDAFVHDEGRTIKVLGELKARGIRIAVDDFGTGYSSMYRLKSLPVTALKLDQVFVSGLPDDTDDDAIASTVIRLGHSLGLTVVAEGVETEAQTQRLNELDCDEFQGYLFGKPMPEAEFCKLYLNRRSSVDPTAKVIGIK